MKVFVKKKMNGKYQVGSGRIVAVTHDTPFIEDIVTEETSGVNVAHWIDNADSWLCSVCGFETNCPNKERWGARKCPRCHSEME